MARFDWAAPGLDVYRLANASAFLRCAFGGAALVGAEPGARASSTPGLTQYYAASTDCGAGRKLALTWGAAAALDWDAQVDASKDATFSAYAVVAVAWTGDWDVYQLRSLASWTECDFGGAVKLARDRSW